MIESYGWAIEEKDNPNQGARFQIIPNQHYFTKNEAWSIE